MTGEAAPGELVGRLSEEAQDPEIVLPVVAVLTYLPGALVRGSGSFKGPPTPSRSAGEGVQKAQGRAF